MADADRVNEAVDADEAGVAEPEQHRVPTPEEVELEYTYPHDFRGRTWQEVVVAGQYFRLILDPACIDIPHEKFRECDYLIDIVYPEGKYSKLLRIGRSAFLMCGNLQRMNAFPKTLKYLEDAVFRDCKCLDIHLVIPNNCVLVGQFCFCGCYILKSVVFEESSLPEHILEIHRFAFINCFKLRSVRLPKSLRAIPEGCFVDCFALVDIPLPQSVRVIGPGSFKYCKKLTSVDFPETFLRLGESAYASCTSLESVTIRCASSSNVQFGPNVFQDCTALSTIRMYPWLYPKLFAAMEQHPRDFLYKFVREYQHQLEQYRVQSR